MGKTYLHIHIAEITEIYIFFGQKYVNMDGRFNRFGLT